MNIHLTKKLTDKLKLKGLPAAADNADPLYSWTANVTVENRQNLVVFMNNACRYAIVLCGVKGKDWQRLPELFTATLCEVWLSEQINPEVIDRYLAEAGEITFTTNTDRKATARLNKTVEEAGWSYYRAYQDGNISNLVVSRNASARLVSRGTGASGYFCPNEMLIELLKRYNLPVKRFAAFDFTIRLDLEGNDAIRRVRLPANITFRQFHLVIQALYNWQDYHLFSFAFYENERYSGEARPVVELVLSEEDLDANPNAILLGDIKLADYFPQWKKCVYTYDYGDDWKHHIEFTQVIDDCEEDLPKLLFASGDAPPEDVGGQGGFKEFLRIIDAAKDPEHDNTMAWAKSQMWKHFDFDEVSCKLKFSLNR